MFQVSNTLYENLSKSGYENFLYGNASNHNIIILQNHKYQYQWLEIRLWFYIWLSWCTYFNFINRLSPDVL